MFVFLNLLNSLVSWHWQRSLELVLDQSESFLDLASNLSFNELVTCMDQHISSILMDPLIELFKLITNIVVRF